MHLRWSLFFLLGNTYDKQQKVAAIIPSISGCAFSEPVEYPHRPRPVDARESRPASAAASRWSSVLHGNRFAKGASMLGLDHPYSLFADGQLSQASRLHRNQRKLARRQVDDAIQRRIRHAHHFSAQSYGRKERW